MHVRVEAPGVIYMLCQHLAEYKIVPVIHIEGRIRNVCLHEIVAGWGLRKFVSRDVENRVSDSTSCHVVDIESGICTAAKFANVFRSGRFKQRAQTLLETRPGIF